MVKKIILGIDIGATWTRFGIFEGKNLIDRVKVRTVDFFSNPFKFLEELKHRYKELDGVGVGTTGSLDMKRGMIVSTANIDVKEFPLRDIIEEALEVTPIIVNDCAAAVWAEAVLGKGKNLRDLVYLTISTGIGAGIVIGRYLIVGRRGNAHEVGHGVIDYNSTMSCSCGGKGHWEALASGKNIPRFVKALTGRDITNAKNLFDAYRRGESWSYPVIEELSRIYAAGISTIIAHYDPEAIFVGGSVFLHNTDILLEKILYYLKEYNLYEESPSIQPTGFGDDVVLYGAAALVLEPPKII